MRVRAVGVLVAVLILIGGGISVFLAVRARNAQAVDTWIGRQVMGIVSSYLEPTIEFASLRYHAPYSVEIRDATLAARDGTQVTRIAALSIELAEVPSSGRPIRIRAIVVDGAAVNLVETPEGGFKGLVPFVRAAPGRESEKTVSQELRLSNVLRLERVTIRNTAIHYAPAGGSPPMVLDGLALDLNVSEETRSEPGWHRIDASFGRLPQLAVSAAGAFNLDTLVAELDTCRLEAELDEATVQSLPPALQALAREHEARGHLSIDVAGRVPLLDAQSGDLACSVDLRAFRVSSGEYTLPIDSATATINLAEGSARLEGIVLRMLGGTITAQGAAHLSRLDRPTEFSWQVQDIDLRALLRGGGEAGQPPKIAGIVTGSGHLLTSLDRPREQLSGSGQIRVHQGRLVVLPALREIAQTLRLAARLGGSAELNHRGDADFDLVPAGLQITKSNVETEFLVARGKGLVGFDKTLDLRVNAGPLEKVQSLLGQVGDLIGRVTDRVVSYRVRGTFADPQVEVLPLGFEL